MPYLSGAEAGANFDYGTAGALSFSYMWTNEYKAPWHIEMDDFYQNDKKTKVDYLHSVGAKYDFKMTGAGGGIWSGSGLYRSVLC